MVDIFFKDSNFLPTRFHVVWTVILCINSKLWSSETLLHVQVPHKSESHQYRLSHLRPPHHELHLAWTTSCICVELVLDSYSMLVIRCRLSSSMLWHVEVLLQTLALYTHRMWCPLVHIHTLQTAIHRMSNRIPEKKITINRWTYKLWWSTMNKWNNLRIICR